MRCPRCGCALVAVKAIPVLGGGEATLYRCKGCHEPAVALATREPVRA